MIMILCILPKQLVGSFLDRHCQLAHICGPKNKTWLEANPQQYFKITE